MGMKTCDRLQGTWILQGNFAFRNTLEVNKPIYTPEASITSGILFIQ